MTEMQHQIENYTLEQLRSMNETNLRETSAPMRDNLLYRLFAAEAYYEFIEKLDN